MTKKGVIKKVEQYIIGEMAKVKEESHGFRHVDRVRKWALKIGRREGKIDLFLLEAAALLHDIGRAYETTKINHYIAGEKVARVFLSRLNFFSKGEVDLICQAVRYHGVGGKEKIVKIIQDADKLDLLGAVVIIRSSTRHYNKPHYIDKNSFIFKKLSPAEINKSIKNGSWDKSIIDHLKLNLSVYDHFHTKTARKMAGEKHLFLKNFIKQFKKETIDLR